MDYPYRFTKTLPKKETRQMPTKQKPQITHTCTQRLIETNTYTNTDTHTHTHANTEM